MKKFFHRLKTYGLFTLTWQFWLSALVAIGLTAGILVLLFNYLDVYTNHGEEIAVPKIMSINVNDAMTELEKMGLDYEVDSFKYDPKFKPLEVLDVYPRPGSMVKKGRRILIRANPKTWRPVAVPNIISKSKYLAFSQLELVGLAVGDTIFEANIAKDVVLRMMYKGKEIKPGVEVPKFAKIDLVLGKGLLQNVNVPNFVGMTLDEAKTYLKQNYFELGSTTYEGSKSKNAIIFYQFPTAGEIYDQGQPVDFWLSEDTSEEDLSEKIKELDNLYKRKIIIDSGSINITIPKSAGNVSEEVRLQTQELPKQPKHTNSAPKSTAPKQKINSQIE